MNTVTLQIPIDRDLKTDTYKMAIARGFSSLQELVRVILAQFRAQKLDITVSSMEEPTVYLSEEAEKRYMQMDDDFKNDRGIRHAKDVDEFLKQLHED